MNRNDFESACSRFNNDYSVWRAAEQTGVDPLFLRSHLRTLFEASQKIEQCLKDNQDWEIADPDWLKISEVREAFGALESSQIEAQNQRSLMDCMDGIPELMLLELDQVLGTSITPEMLAKFDDLDEPSE